MTVVPYLIIAVCAVVAAGVVWDWASGDALSRAGAARLRKLLRGGRA